MLKKKKIGTSKKEPVITSFKVRAGFHSNGDETYRKGQVFNSDKALHKDFPNKFDVVATNANRPVKTQKKARYNQVKPLEELGKDVTAKFPDAVNQGLRVYQTEDGDYNVTEENDLFTPINAKPLTRLKTKKFLENHS